MTKQGYNLDWLMGYLDSSRKCLKLCRLPAAKHFELLSSLKSFYLSSPQTPAIVTRLGGYSSSKCH